MSYVVLGTKAHGYLDYIMGKLLIVAPWLSTAQPQRIKQASKLLQSSNSLVKAPGYSYFNR